MPQAALGLALRNSLRREQDPVQQQRRTAATPGMGVLRSVVCEQAVEQGEVDGLCERVGRAPMLLRLFDRLPFAAADVGVPSVLVTEQRADRLPKPAKVLGQVAPHRCREEIVIGGARRQIEAAFARRDDPRDCRAVNPEAS